MILFPAIDLKDNKVVRLQQGRFGDVTVYSHDPVEIAKKWEQDGALWLHGWYFDLTAGELLEYQPQGGMFHKIY